MSDQKDLATRPDISAEVMETAIIKGDLAALTPKQRNEYYIGLCNRLGLDPATQPFKYLKLQGALTLYATKDAAAQLRRVHGISITDLRAEILGEIYVVTVHGENAKGRRDVATGAVPIKGKSGEQLANAMLKAETKSKRRLTLSLAGLGFLDETEAESVVATGRAKVVEPDPQSDEAMIEAEPEEPESEADPETGEIPEDEPTPVINDANDFWVELEARYNIKPGNPQVKALLADRAKNEADHHKKAGYWQRSWNFIVAHIASVGVPS